LLDVTRPGSEATYLYRRHALALRVLHWINALAVFILLMSGLQIFNAHPALYWGQSSYTGDPPIASIGAYRAPDGSLIGITQIDGARFHTTGVLGVSSDSRGAPVSRGFPSWATIPGDRWLAIGRSWHFFFAWLFVLNGAAYAIHSVVSRRLQRELAPRRGDWRSLGRTLKDHLMLRHARGEAARRYNLLQQLAYLGVMFAILPFMVLTGLSMSPRINAALPGWVDLLGGRQSGRTLHFIGASLILAFILVHLFQVVATGPWNNLRSMMTGNYRIRREPVAGNESSREPAAVSQST
jgi:thiosulfate reductase cytochrome b subunit